MAGVKAEAAWTATRNSDPRRVRLHGVAPERVTSRVVTVTWRRGSSDAIARAAVVDPETLRVRLTVAYDGSAYAGWQVQRTGVGVQQKLEEALHRLFGAALRVHGSSRTDTGVHALGMVAHVDVPARRFRMPMTKLPLALNAHLPEDIRVVSARRSAAGFHARFDAAGKEYRYTVWNHRVMNPLLRRTAWHVPTVLDLAAMRAAAASLVGTHDFRSFAANRHYEVPDTVRHLMRCEVRRSGPQLTVVMRGDGFLYKMCRGIVGTLIQVGQGKIAPEEMPRILRQRDRRVAGMTAPAHGLVLWRVFYARRAGTGSAVNGRSEDE